MYSRRFDFAHRSPTDGYGCLLRRGCFSIPTGFRLRCATWVEQGCRAAAYAALRAGFNRRLEHFEKRDAAGVLCFTATDFATQAADTAGVDADACSLGNVFHNRAGGRVDGVEAVVAFNQYAA